MHWQTLAKQDSKLQIKYFVQEYNLKKGLNQ